MGIPLTFYFLLRQKKEDLSVKEVLKIFILNCLAWGIGYAATWFTKFILVDILYNKNLLYIGFKQILHRTLGLSTEINRFGVILANIKNLNIYILAITFIVTLLFVIIKLVTNHKKYEWKLNNILPYVLIGIMPFFWYIILKEHSYRHRFFTFRTLFLAVMNFFIIINVMLKKKENNNERK